MNKNIEKAMEMQRIAALALNKDFNENIYGISSKYYNLNLVLSPDTLSPFLIGLTDMLMEQIFEEEGFKSLYPVLLEKRENSLCFLALKDNPDYNINNSGSSLVLTGLLTMNIMENVFQPALDNKIDLNHMVNVCRNEFASYKEGEIIDLRNHKENLVSNNLQKNPALRLDLQNDKKNALTNTIFNAEK